MAAELPADMVMPDRLLSETAFGRILMRGDWEAMGPDGEWHRHQEALLFGANSRPMPVRVKGPFTVVGFALRPCGWPQLFDRAAREYADTMGQLESIWGDTGKKLWADIQSAESDDMIVTAMISAIRARKAELGDIDVSEAIAKFEPIIISDSTRKVEDIAADLGLSLRQLERLCIKHFGHTPKMIMRRSRFLDMAAVIRGLSTPSEAELAELSFFDQSHLIREFRQFIGMTSAEFEKAQTPLLDAGLDLRQKRKVMLRKMAAA
nr:helix-turn-helix domain-containing protein [Sphingorhabdus sp. Alg239-R122]